MKIILRMNEINYDITPIVDISNLHKEVEMEISTEGTFNTASFVIPSAEQFELGPYIDFSRAIIRNSLVTIERDDEQYQWRVMGDSVTENPNGTFTHNIQLIDRRSETTGINLPGLTLTQSKSEQGSFVRSIHGINKSGYIGNYWMNAANVTYNNSSENGINITSANSTVPTTFNIQSADLNVIDGMTIKDADGIRPYTISLSMNLVNTQVNDQRYLGGGGYSLTVKYSDAIIYYTIKIMAGSTLLSTSSDSINPASAKSWHMSTLEPTEVNLTTKKYTKTLTFIPTAETTISVLVEITGSGNYVKYVDPVVGTPTTSTQSDSLSINDLNLNIYTPVDVDPSRKTLDYYVNKLLTNMFIDEAPLYTLSTNSASRLSQIIAPEFTMDGYNLYQAIQEIADFLGASWQITPNNEIDFIFFDDDNIIDFDDEQKQITTGVSDLNDYASSVQLNAENIASNTIKKEVNLTVRATEEGNAKLTTDNLMIKTGEPINYINKVVFRDIVLTDGSGTITSESEWNNITNRVLTKEEWDILPGNFDKSTTGRDSMTKNNTLYFIRGQKGLYGLSYVGGVAPGFLVANDINRSLFETLAAQAYQATGRSATNKDLGITTHNLLKVDIEYYPFTSSNVHIYKDDQTGFQIERHKYFNESSRVNDPDLIGKVAQNTVNRLGGTEYTTTGYLETIQNIPKLGTLNSQNRRLTKLILQMTDTYVRYTATYVSDYTKISKFVGKKSDYRLYEIPNTAIVESNRIKRNRIMFGSTNQGPNIFSVYLFNLYNYKAPSPLLAKLIFNHSIGTSTIYSTVISNEFGKSASWKVRMPNNFSAGVKKVMRNVETEDVYFQEEVRYTDNLGRVNSVDITFYSDYSAGDSYPESATNLVQLLQPQTHIYDKDAREIFSFEYETSFGSIDLDKYRLYDGITKYNSFINGRKNYEIKCKVLNYIPNKNDLKVDLTKVSNTSVGVSVGYSSISATTSVSGMGLVFYDDISLDLLLVVKDTIGVGTYVIPYGLPEELVVRTVTFNTDGGTSVLNQEISNGMKIVEPTTTKIGHTFEGWYTEPEFINLFDFDTPITSNLTLYAKWEAITGRTWERVYTSIYQTSISPAVPSYQCPLNYSVYLPDANNYEVGHTINITPYRLCDPETEICLLEPMTMTSIARCPSQQYRVVST